MPPPRTGPLASSSAAKNAMKANDENAPPSPLPPADTAGAIIRVPLSSSPVRVPLRRLDLESSQNCDQGERYCSPRKKLDYSPDFDDSDASQDTGVKVVVRVRPINKREQAQGATRIVSAVSSTSIIAEHQLYTFDGIAGESSSQQDIFQLVGAPMVEHCIAGFNSSIFAFGQTGSGKTYTMWGTVIELNSGMYLSDDTGLAPQVFKKLFPRIQEEQSNRKQVNYKCRCSFLEIYNEQIKDLLEPTTKNLQIREDTRMGVYVENLTEEPVSGVEDVNGLLLKGLANRRIGSTGMNNESSRSHCLFTCIVECHSMDVSDGTTSIKSSKINLVDLAGSERQKLTGAAGERLKEAGNINRSLSQLGNVINILADTAQTGKQRHIPYRNSKLTFLLQESLGGNSQLAVICAISPASSCKAETLGTLRFAQRAKSIQNKAVVNEETTTDANFLREQIRQLKDELKTIKGLKDEGHFEEKLRMHALEVFRKQSSADDPAEAKSMTRLKDDDEELDWMLIAKILHKEVEACQAETENERQGSRVLREAFDKLLTEYAALEERHVDLVARQRVLREGARHVAQRLGAIAVHYQN